ncbi:hypothetical protein KYT87_25805 [Achromobacter sp. ES-001]|uniref:hypothetical protein n=1 Tax=Achromobacter sp. ES-001 TaxID=2860286 RepID=UPI001C63E2EF|nr:hypothetical protein [Achromobacter sp. ES-001]QYJ20989.1 hypothetical protein KYT87_25805 [Achromobacter sp. ES-001]
MMVKMVLVPLFIVGNVFLSCAYATGSKIFYDLSSACGYAVESDRPLSNHLHDCSMLYEDPVNSPFFYGGIVSFKARDLPFTQLEFLKFADGQLTSSRRDYYDATRDTRQRILARHRYSFPKSNNEDAAIITRLEVQYLRETPDSLEIVPTKERYDCWDGVALGKIWAVQYSLCSLVSHHKDPLFSRARWQYQVIKSLNIR